MPVHPLDLLTEAARWAPSGDNTQPWRFEVNYQDARLSIFLDESRDPSPMNAGQRMARIAVGAAVENAVTTAQANGWTIAASFGTVPQASLQLSGPCGNGVLPASIMARVSNRRPYDGTTLEPSIAKDLHRLTTEELGVRTVWLLDREQIANAAEWISRADAIMLGDPWMRQAFLENVRFDAPVNAEVAEGLSLASLELPMFERIGLRVLRFLPDVVVRGGGIAQSFAGHSRKLLLSASGLCFLLATGDTIADNLNVGRALQRVWLDLAARGLSAQPMMSLPVLDNAIVNRGRATSRTLQAAAEVLSQDCPAVSGPPPQRIAAVLRFGFGAAPSGRTGRRPADAIVTKTAGVPSNSEHRPPQ